MKSTLLIGTSLFAAANALLPLKNFPVKGRNTADFDKTNVANPSCAFATLTQLLPAKTIDTYYASADQDLGYIGGLATRIQLSDYSGYNYYMRGETSTNLIKGNINGGWGAAIPLSKRTGVQCIEFEEHTLSHLQRGDAFCGRASSGIRMHGTTPSYIKGGDDSAGHDFAVSESVRFSVLDNATDLCASATYMGPDGIFADSSCSPVSSYTLNQPTNTPNGISLVIRSCTDNSQGTTCTDTIGSQTFDVAIASTCGVSGGANGATFSIGSVEEAFVWYRYERPEYTITTTTSPTSAHPVIISPSTGPNSVNHWLGDVLFVQPKQVVYAPSTSSSLDVTPLYVTSATASVSFGSTKNGNEVDEDVAVCAISQGVDDGFNELNDAAQTISARCTAELDASVQLNANTLTGCNPGAFLRSSLVQFARIHNTHVEVGTNATAYQGSHILGYQMESNGAAAKYAAIAGLTGNGNTKTDEWQCEETDKCETGNPFVVLHYGEHADMYHTDVEDQENGNVERLSVSTSSGRKLFINPATLGDGDAAVAYTYIIGYVDFGFGCFQESGIYATTLIDHGGSRRLGATAPQKWETHSQMIFAGGHHVDI